MRSTALVFSILVCALVPVRGARAQELTLTPLHANGIYRVGEKAGWAASLSRGPVGESAFRYVVKKNGLEVLKQGSLHLVSGIAMIDVTVDEPAMISVEVSGASARADGGTDHRSSTAGPAGKTLIAAAAVAPEELAPSVPGPPDFDRFWDSRLRMLRRIPANPLVTPRDSGSPDIDYATIRLDHINRTHVYGQLAKPAKKGTFPGLVIFQWASPPYPLQRHWVTDYAGKGWLALNIEPHDVLPDQPPSYYEALPQSLKEYQKIGRDSRDKSYFLQMYLADYRAIEYLASRPDWDGKTLVVMGTSMGGQQALCAAALNARVTAVIVNEPAGADANGPLHGRASGYPNWPADDPESMKTGLYFDTVNCASRIEVPALVSMGFVDTTAPPVGIWTAFNQIRGPKEAAPMIDSPHNNLATPEQQRPYTARSAEWLGTLRAGGQIRPPAASAAVQRADLNSRIAHTQLVEKARAGGISVYFVGDSITRRWGSADEEYKDLYANWTRNFLGWNAADFGWGGDTTRNILWRLTNGELDGVNPKVIVSLAGTNDLPDPALDDDAKVNRVTEGIRAILDVCRAKAPAAAIILMAVTPRNDHMSLLPVIERINANIARFADGRTIRYLNINSQLADEQGRLREGMVNPDGLHLAVKGYQVWADALKPIFTELLGPRGTVDTAPPPSRSPGVKEPQSQ